MSVNALNSLVFDKYDRFLPRVFPGVARLDVSDRNGTVLWSWSPKTAAEGEDMAEDETTADEWTDFGAGIQRCQRQDGFTQFRAILASRAHGPVGWLTTTYNTKFSTEMSTAPEPLRCAFADAKIFLQEEIDLQSECNQLAEELGERYEELNLVYSTKDQVEYFEEGQEALVTLVHNCADYLDVGLAALICRERGVTIHNINSSETTASIDNLIELLSTKVYDRVESQVQCVVLNESADDDRVRLLEGRSENVLAYPIVDDHGSAIGLLAVVAKHGLHEFSNGDRNLLEIMARKATRIIHTHHDSLTGLMNRSGFESSLIGSLASTQSKNMQHCLLQINIDRLHVVNDLLGYQEGDMLIRRVAKLLRNLLRDTDVTSRIGGGEFGVLLPSCDVRQGYAVAEKVRRAIGEMTVVSNKRTLDVSACIGIAHINRDSEGIVSVMAAAEIACKSAKEDGRDRTQIFEADNTMLVRRSAEIEWMGRLQEALREGTFVLYCQPVLPLLELSKPPHYEILVRLRDEDGGILAPGEFLPAAERYQLMPMVDRWVIHNTLKALCACWPDIAAKHPVFCINLSGQSFSSPGFKAFIDEEIRQAGVPPQNICFEVTETVAIANIDDAINFMASLRKIGCRFSLDDFGAGLSSFGYLKELPVDYLKIDGSFVREITTDEISLSMVKAICQIGRTMKLSMVAEYVGDEETKDALRVIGVDYVQGFGIGRPVALSGVLEQLQSEASAALA